MLAKELFFINSRCKGILDSVKNEIIVINPGNEILFANKPATKLIGNNYYGKKIDTFLQKDELARFKSAKKENKTVCVSIFSKKYNLSIKKEENYYILNLEDGNYAQNIEKISLLNKMLALFSSEKDFKKIFAAVIEELIKFINFESGGIYLVQDDYLVLKAQKNLPAAFVKRVSKIKIERGYKKIFEKKSATILDYEKYKPEESKRINIKLVICIPIINDGKPMGLINIASGQLLDINPKLIDTIENLANIIGNLIKKNESETISKINEERFNAIAHITDEFILVINKNKTITYSSRSFSKLEYNREDLVGLKFGKICKNYSKHLLKEKKTMLNIADSVGNIHLFETSINTVMSDRSIIFISRDVTEKRSFDKMIRNEKDKLQKYLNNIPMIFLALDLNGNIQMINQKGCDILKEEKKKIIGKNWFDNFLPKKIQKNMKNKFFRALYSEKKEYNELIANIYENEIICSNKETRIIEWTNSFIKNEKGTITFMLSVGRDITNEKEKEKEIENLRRSNELSEVRKNFLMLVTHELKQPLTPIMGYADLLKENIVDTEKLKFLDRIINGGQEMLDLITRIINLMKLESGELMFNFREVSILKIIEEALRKKASFINLKSIRIERKIKDVNFTGDFNLLRDVMLNLIDNAVKFSPEKSVIIIKTSVSKNNLLIRVIDQGVGMKKEDANNLFESFKQSEIGRKRGGFGIGLAMSKMIIEKHNGKIYAKSAPNKGSTFKVKLPIKNKTGEKK